jgi:hypothetical protein
MLSEVSVKVLNEFNLSLGAGVWLLIRSEYHRDGRVIVTDHPDNGRLSRTTGKMEFKMNHRFQTRIPHSVIAENGQTEMD